MSARILVVDDVPANVKLLETKLAAEYFDVVTATNGQDALAICREGGCDVVLLDVMMPGMDGFEVCRQLKGSAATAHLPVVIVTALDQPGDRLAGLEAGADDFLTKPVDKVALLARVRSLVRLKSLSDELRSGVAASFGGVGPGDPASEGMAAPGRILVVEDRESSWRRLEDALAPVYRVSCEPDPARALAVAEGGEADVVVVSLDLAGFDALRLCSQIRAGEVSRDVAVLPLAYPEDRARILRALDIGVHDFITRPVDRNELVARVRTLLRKKRHVERLRERVHASLALAVTDGLTGLHNRRFLDTALRTAFSELGRAKPLSLLMLDVDRFKAINDTYGHGAGDEVLREFSRRVQALTRADDVVARFGGEEVVVLLPGTSADEALAIAERIREKVGGVPFSVEGRSRLLNVTVSIGIASRRPGDVGPPDLLRRADGALYAAKKAGRNKVELAAA